MEEGKKIDRSVAGSLTEEIVRFRDPMGVLPSEKEQIWGGREEDGARRKNSEAVRCRGWLASRGSSPLARVGRGWAETCRARLAGPEEHGREEFQASFLEASRAGPSLKTAHVDPKKLRKIVSLIKIIWLCFCRPSSTCSRVFVLFTPRKQLLR